MTIISAGGAVVGAGGSTQYEIERSLRFNSADSANLTRTPASASNRKTWTWSGWVKRSALGSAEVLFGSRPSGASNENAFIVFNSSNAINIFSRNPNDVVEFTATTNAVFRDPSAWYHVLFYLDTTQSTSTNRMALYVNGVQQTFSSSTYPTQNLDCYLNQNVIHQLGSSFNDGYLNGYMTEIHFIDGQALDETDFGEFSPTTGVWGPIAYTGSYGTNGFYLNFSDNSGVTSTTLGKDQAGSNNWTPNNFSVTAGAGNDSLVDTCTLFGTDTGVGGEVRGNYATMNPLDQAGGLLFAEGNLKVTAATGWDGARSTFSYPATGKWYWEALCIARSTGATVGILSTSAVIVGDLGDSAAAYIYNSGDGNKYNGGVNSAYGATWTTNDLISIAWDADTGTLSFYKNGVSQGTAYSSLSGQFSPAIGVNGSDSMQANFGNRPFAYTAPSGFKALVTTNLPDPTVIEGDEYFNTVLYTGTGASNARTGVGFQPDWVWIKERNAVADHGLYDAVRGVQNQLESNTTTAETAEATGLTAFGADGFTVGALAQLNTSADTYVAWNWKANGAGVSNTAGTISSTVSANTDAGFSIVTYTGTGVAATIGHGLGVAPSMVITKVRSTANDWGVYHSGINDPSKALLLNSTAAAAAYGGATGMWNNTAPTSTVFSVGTNGSTGGSATYVAYCFAAIPGYSAFGSYTGNGAADGPFVFTGFRPAWVMWKNSSSGSQWILFDVKRGTYNIMNGYLEPNTSDAENTTSAASGVFDILSNGFKLRAIGTDYNDSGDTYIFMAFAENPFKFALAR